MALGKAMNEEYPLSPEVRYRIIEKRTPLLPKFVAEKGLSPLKSVGCKPLPWCEPKRCFVNVDEQVKRAGGKMETGWIFGEFEERMIESEAHAVWMDWSGRRHDITPHRFQPERVLFSPDPRVANVRGYTAPYKLMLTKDPKIRAIEDFDSRIDAVVAAKFGGFGVETVVTNEEVRLAAEQSGLPLEVATRMVLDRNAHDRRIAQRYAGR